MVTGVSKADSDHIQDAGELRAHVARSLHGHAEVIARDAVALFPFAGVEQVAADDRAPLAERIVHLLTSAVRDSALDGGDILVSELAQLAERKNLSARTLFTVVYLVERAAVDALTLDDSFGMTAAPWPTLAQTVRRAAFDLCGAMAERVGGGAMAPTITDPLTTLHTRAVFVAAVEKEIQRSERFGEPFALMLIDVDRLADINGRYGYGAGDRVLERVGILVRKYFRDTDWVARLGEDTFAVLLPNIVGHNAERLAERMRITVQERLQLHDHRSDQAFPVTISVGVLIADSVERSEQAERLITAGQEAIDRAKIAGGNRIERAVFTGGQPQA